MDKNVIPNNALVIMVGVPGSGKSTISNSFEDANIISTDAIREEILGSEEDNTKNDLIFKEFYKRIDDSLKDGKLTIADSTAINRQTRKDLYMLATKNNRPIRLIIMNIAKNIAKSQNSSRSRGVPDEVIDRMYDRLIDEYNYINEEIDFLKSENVDVEAIDIVRTKNKGDDSYGRE